MSEDRLRAAVIEYLAADADMPEFADAQRLPPEEWDRRNRRWAAADERHAIEAILDRPYADPDDDAAIAARAALRLAQQPEPGLDWDALTEALHDAMCDVSHHDRPPARCTRWPKYPAIVASTRRRYARLTASSQEPGS